MYAFCHFAYMGIYTFIQLKGRKSKPLPMETCIAIGKKKKQSRCTTCPNLKLNQVKILAILKISANCIVLLPTVQSAGTNYYEHTYGQIKRCHTAITSFCNNWQRELQNTKTLSLPSAVRCRVALHTDVQHTSNN